MNTLLSNLWINILFLDTIKIIKYLKVLQHCNFSQVLYKAPWWWILYDPKHVGALLNIL